jgi:hypothetical protein
MDGLGGRFEWETIGPLDVRSHEDDLVHAEAGIPLSSFVHLHDPSVMPAEITGIVGGVGAGLDASQRDHPHLARWSDEVGIVGSSIYGGFHLALACWASDGEPTKTWVTNITSVAAEPLRILRLPAIVSLTDSASLAVIALADILFYGTGAGLSLQAIMPPDD